MVGTLGIGPNPRLFNVDVILNRHLIHGQSRRIRTFAAWFQATYATIKHHTLISYLVGVLRFELRFHAPKARVLPGYTIPQKFLFNCQVTCHIIMWLVELVGLEPTMHKGACFTDRWIYQ